MNSPGGSRGAVRRRRPQADIRAFDGVVPRGVATPPGGFMATVAEVGLTCGERQTAWGPKLWTLVRVQAYQRSFSQTHFPCRWRAAWPGFPRSQRCLPWCGGSSRRSWSRQKPSLPVWVVPSKFKLTPYTKLPDALFLGSSGLEMRAAGVAHGAHWRQGDPIAHVPDTH